MKLREIFRYEVAYRARSGATWAYAGILFLVAMWMFLATADGAEHANAPERVAGGTLLAGMFGMLVTAALFADAALRDVEAGMDSLLYTTRVSRSEYLAGRFLGALAVNALVALAIPLGILAATGIAATGAETVGPFRLAAHLEPYFTLLLPNIVWVGSILFAVAVLTRQAVPVYLAAIGVFIGYVVALNYVQNADSALVVATLDPIGMLTLTKVTELWTEAERNARLVGLPALLAWNRAVWLAVAALVQVGLHRAFRFGHAEEGGRRGRARRSSEPTAERAWPVSVPRVAGSFGRGTAVRQTLAVARESLANVVASRWFAVVLLACVGLTMLWGWNVADTVFDTSTWPITMLIVEEVLSSRNAPLPYLLIALYAGELVWRERETGAAQIADAAPVSDAAALLGRFLALALMLVLFMAATMAGGLLIQALQGYYHFEIGLYLRVVFGMRLVHYLMLAALAMTIHVMVNHKYLGHVVVVLGFLAPMLLQALGLVRHHLLLYATDPGWTYSDMNGFGPYAEPFAWFRLYWAAWAGLLLLVAVVLRVRGQETGPRRRLREARARVAGPVARAAALCVALIALSGGFVFYNTNVLNDFPSRGEVGARQAAYETRYARYVALPQPTIVAAELRIEIHPDAPAVELRGAYRLVNRTGAPIDSVHVYVEPDVAVRALGFDRASEPVLVDEEVGYRVHALAQPLAPGDSVRLEFELEYAPRGFPNGTIQTDVVANGTSINRRLLPFIGYQPLFELPGAAARARFGLPPREPMPDATDTRALAQREPFTDADEVHVDAVIGTAIDQVAVTPGLLQRSWTENGRRYFHYRTETPVSFGAAVYSARYAVVEDRWKDVALRIYHHPAHRSNLDSMLRGMKASLEFFTAEFGPYPYSDLRIVEIPRYGGFGIAHPHTIGFTEDVFFARVEPGEIDQTFYGTAHEVAHTWWGGLLRGAQVRGASFLSESLANYSAMILTERTFGREFGRRVYGFQMGRYLRGRATQSREVPALEVEDQPYIAYRKGALALYTLREHIGEERVNAALRAYAERFRDAGPPYPTARDLYAELRAVTPDSLHPLLTDWFETVTLWDIETERASAERTARGEYVVTLEIEARKLRADSAGNESEVPMDDLVEVAVFAAGERAPMYRARHRIRSGEQTLRVTVPREPVRAGVDPDRMLIERDREDDFVDVQPVRVGD